MAENTNFAPPEAPKINWLYVGGGVVGLVVILYLMNKGSGGSSTGTVAAGSSINAALGSLEESALNIQGSQSFAQNSLDTISGSQAGITSGISNLSNSLTGVSNSLTNQIGTVNSNIQGVNNNISGLSGQVSQSEQDILSSQSAILNTLLTTRDQIAASFGTNSQQVTNITNQINTLEQQMQAGFTGLGAEIGSIVNQINTTAKVTAGQLSALTGNIIFSNADNTRYLVQNSGLVELTYGQEMALRGQGAQIMYVNPSLAQYKIGGSGDRG